MTTFGETVVHHSRVKGDPDSLGNDTWTDVDKTYRGVSVGPRAGSELVQGEDLTIIGLTAVFAPAIDLTAADEFTVRGERWSVDGMPGQYRSSLTGRSLTTVNLTRVEG